MEEKDAINAEAILAVLAAPLKWHDDVSTVGGPRYTADTRGAAAAEYVFAIQPPHKVDLGRDADGKAFDWMLSVTILDSSTMGRNQPGMVGNSSELMGKWYFPCRTVPEAKAICERLVLTDDTGEVSHLDRLRYPLAWRPAHPPGDRVRYMVFVVKNALPVARYSVERKRWWFFPYFTAGYRFNASFYHEHRQDTGFGEETQAAYLQAFDLRPPSRSLHRYRTEADAKAACEQHHWTGNWEG